jgi:DNA-binding NarL/FixJ family response regulator
MVIYSSPDKVHNMLALGAKKYILKAEYRLDEIIQMIREMVNDADPMPSPGVGGEGAAPPPVAQQMQQPQPTLAEGEENNGEDTRS